MAPTERALALAGPLRAAMLTLEQGLEPPTAFDPATAERDFTIATNDFVAFAMLPRLLGRLQREAPRVRLQVRAWQEHVVPLDLGRGDADLALGFNRGLPPGHQSPVETTGERKSTAALAVRCSDRCRVSHYVTIQPSGRHRNLPGPW